MKAVTSRSALLLACLLVVGASAPGCQSFIAGNNELPLTLPVPSPVSDIPHEMSMVSLPLYTIEPPDVLEIRAVKIVPKFPYSIEPLDVLAIQVTGTHPDQPPIFGTFIVDGDGKVDLGASYGSVAVRGLTLEEAKSAIVTHLELDPNNQVVSPEASVVLVSSPGFQQIAGLHLVAPDGTVNLGVYGRVRVTGLTIKEATDAVNTRLSEYLEAPEATIDVATYDSKVYYIITEGAGLGDNVVQVPITGGDTVLDAIALINGISPISSQNIWIARPTSGEVGFSQILPVDWVAITRGASTATNYQLMPGDRVFIAEDRLTAANSVITKVIQPFERILGFMGLGTNTFNRIERFGQRR